MKSIGIFIAIISLLNLFSTPIAFTQPAMGRRGGGWGWGTQYQRMYDPKTVETIAGEVVRVDLLTPIRGMSGGVHLQLKTPKEVISVHLGPSWYLENQDTQIAVKDRIEVKGSRISFAGQPTIIAAEVTKEGRVLKLRDESGFPVWSGWSK